MSGRRSRSRLAEIREVGRCWWIRVLLVFVAIIGTGAIAGLRLNVSGSLPLGIYSTVGDASAIQRGSIVIVCLPLEWTRFAVQRQILGRGSCEGGSYGLGKVVLATAGDIVEVRREGLTLNGSPVPNSRSIARDRKGLAMPHATWGRHALQNEEIWLFSPHDEAGFDSRYFGPVATSRVRSVVSPIVR